VPPLFGPLHASLCTNKAFSLPFSSKLEAGAFEVLPRLGKKGQD